MNKPLILVVEDDSSVKNLITTTLKAHDYRHLTAPNGKAAILEASSHNPDIVLLDLGLPDIDGVDVIKKIRTWSNMPIIVISARSEDTDKIDALDAGADDYLVKPFEFDELLARIRVMLRRDNRENLTSSVVFGDYCLDFVKKTLTQNGQLIDLTSKEFELLECLVRHPNIVLSREQIREHIWDFDYVGESNIIDVLVKNIRKKLGNPSIIQTKRGMGYVFKNEESD